MFDIADTTLGTVGIERIPLCILRTHHGRETSTRSTAIDALCLGINGLTGDAVFLDVFAQRCAIDTLAVETEQSALGQFAQDAQNTTSAVLFLNGVFLSVGCEFTEEGHLARQGVNILHVEVHISLLCYGQQVEYGIR